MSLPHPTFRTLLGLVALLALSALLAACGNSAGAAGPEELLERALAEEVESADVALSARSELEGEGAGGTASLTVRGPVRLNGDERIPDVDLQIARTAEGEEDRARLIAADENAWVELDGRAYAVGRQLVSELDRRWAAERREGEEEGVGALGLDPVSWLAGAEERPGETLDGVETRKVAGEVDVARMLFDLRRAAQRSPAPADHALGELSDEQIRTIAEGVREAPFEASVGREDGKLRRVVARAVFEVPEDSRERAGGIEGGSFAFRLDQSDVDGDQQIEPGPDDARPLSELLERLGAGDAGWTSTEPAGALSQ